ncbi:rhamnulokinase family protein [Isoptericola sp. BMS4]|uniref:rhamnulokinase n=1 Tax=Isoptericola sp. BMS4 TaxID=2527875 RepID=UPI001422FA5A|nr:rhamnulokinase family protein [Isoptericola sp. BMS4]
MSGSAPGDDGAARTPAFVAVDLGATSGRVMLGVLHGELSGCARGIRRAESDNSRVELVETGRFPNGPVSVPRAGSEVADLRWDVLGLWRGIVDGLREAGRVAADRGARVAGIGVDSWAVDYGLLDDDGALVGAPRSYRDPRILGASDRVDARIPAAERYAVNGLQHLPFETLHQLVAGTGDVSWARARGLLLIPDLVTCWLTGRQVAEVTNASTTGLLDARTRQWSRDLLARLGDEFDGLAGLGDLLSELVEPGTVVGPLAEPLAAETGLGAVPVIAVASHDTASAVAAIPLGVDRPGRAGNAPGNPAGPGRAAYVSSGTWSLVGLELDEPVLTEASRRANVTNELGLDGTVRYLRNVMGLWVLDECVREWRRGGDEVDLGALLAAAAEEPGGRCVVDVDSDAFLAPGDMPSRFRDAARAAGQEVPETRPALVRAVLDSLAAAYARVVSIVSELAGVEVTAVHVAGGGVRNELLCRLTAEATGLPVVAGPVEAAALGNVLVQARAVGALGTGPDGGPPGLPALRAVVVRSTDLATYRPAGESTGAVR